MLSREVDGMNAEMRFRDAFCRLRNDEPKIMPHGTAVTQNNVAREAGCDASALRKSRFPALVREIQAYVDLRDSDRPSKHQINAGRRGNRRTLEERLADALLQRDSAQSMVVSANRRIVELTEQVRSLQLRIDELGQRPR
jgi:hypothetical protein